MGSKGVSAASNAVGKVTEGIAKRSFIKSAVAPSGKQGLTNFGRGLQKHVDREGSSFSGVKFSHKTANQDGLNVLNQIINSEDKLVAPASKGGSYVFDKSTGMGYGVSRSGKFNGFRDIKEFNKNK